MPRRTFMPAALAASLAGALACPAAAQDAGAIADTPEVVQKLFDCRDIADPSQRLACYDAQVAEVVARRESKDLVFADREQVQEARRGLFGLSLPRIRLFDGSDEPEFQEITTTIKRAERVGRGSWAFELEDGARWVQNDSFQILGNIEPGTEVTISKGALTSYTAKIGKKRAIKVVRVQ